MPIQFRTLTPRDGYKLFEEIMNEGQKEKFEKTHDLDFAYSLEGVGRFRVNMFMQRKGMGGVFRIIPERIKTVDELKLPGAVKHFAELERGLVLVTGPTGSGKSTTLAAIIDIINTHQKKHIVTIEDPIEFVHPKKMAHISQREVGAHTVSFSAALKSALRESRSEERRVGKECRSRWSPDH